MAKVSYANMKLKVNSDVETVEFEGASIEVKQYLPISDKYDLIMITLQQSKEDGIYNELKKDVFFHLNLVFMYTNLSFTDKQREDLMKLYDQLESSGLIELIIKKIPESEYKYLYDSMKDISAARIAFEGTISGAILTAIERLAVNAEKAAEIVENFNPEKYGEVVNFAKAVGVKLN